MSSNPISIGKIRGLTSTSTSRGVFNILAFDHRQSFVKMLQAGSQISIPYAKVVEAKSAIVKALARHASAVLLDPVYGAAQAIANGSLPGGTGLLVALEETGYTGSDTGRVTTLLPGWSVEKAKKMGADAVKLLVYFHPAAGEITEQQEKLAAQVIQACRQVDIALFLEAVTYSADIEIEKDSVAFAEIRPQLIAETARKLGNLGPDVLKLEFPVNATYDLHESHWAAACDALSQASPCPWALLSAGVDFNLFARQVEIACRYGASGYIGGRALWKEGVALPAPERESWLQQTVAKRLDILNEIASRYARPWQEFYKDLKDAAYEGWYEQYV